VGFESSRCMYIKAFPQPTCYTVDDFIFGTHHNISHKLCNLASTLNAQEVSHKSCSSFWSLLWAMRM
jgi:hypothetical protein